MDALCSSEISVMVFRGYYVSEFSGLNDTVQLGFVDLIHIIFAFLADL